MADAHVTAGKINVGSNRIGIELRCASVETSTWVAFEERSGWLVAGIANPGGLPKLSQAQISAFRDALAGLYKMSGVDLVREQIEASFEPGKVAFDILEEGLVVWPSTGYEVQALYPLRDGQVLQPQIPAGPFPVSLPGLDASRLICSHMAISWSSWVETWEADQAGKAPAAQLLVGVSLLPDRGSQVAARALANPESER
jgi:hypothetical protein